MGENPTQARYCEADERPEARGPLYVSDTFFCEDTENVTMCISCLDIDTDDSFQRSLCWNFFIPPHMRHGRLLMADSVIKNGKKLRCGFTTGSCAAAAAAAALQTLLTGERTEFVRITLPGGITAGFEPLSYTIKEGSVTAAVRKDAGDDPDVTDGVEITATVSFGAEHGEVRIFGGEGVGTVTAQGLKCPVGEAAINPVPRRMIKENARRILQQYECAGGVDIVIGAVNGRQIAQRTYNPRLGITDGISILGTTGIVEPMSEKALIDTVQLLIDQAKTKNPARILITPGNYGSDFCSKELGLTLEHGVQFSNFIGETLDYLVFSGFSEALLVGHAGKLVKIAAGVMNTHSSVADGRMEVFAAHSAAAGAPSETVRRILECKTTDAAAAILQEAGLLQEVAGRILQKVCLHIDYRTKALLKTEVIVFLNDHTVLCETPGARELAKKLAGKESPSQ